MSATVSAFVGGVRNGKAFQVTMSGGDSHSFDSFECAIHALAPACEYCGVKVIGHGVEAGGSFYCCAHCAGMAGAEGVSDRLVRYGIALPQVTGARSRDSIVGSRRYPTRIVI